MLAHPAAAADAGDAAVSSALIGYTGFVGSNIARCRSFTDLYNTANIDSIRGRSFDLLVSAASRADSHRINNEGAADLAEVEQYLRVLESVQARKVVLISTVCVYPGDTTPDESSALTTDALTPYGANRLHLEQAVAQRFDTLVVRLPQLYGDNLKKGIVYDLHHDYRVEFIRPDGCFQYYDLRRLWADVEVALAAGLTSLNVATPPLRSGQVALDVFGRDIGAQVVPGAESPFSRMYTRDMRTRHAVLYGGPQGYLMDRDAELAALRAWAAEDRPAEDRPADRPAEDKRMASN